MAAIEAVDLNYPTIRYDNLTEDASRWDKIAAASSQEDMVQQWWGLGTVSLITTVIVATILSSILFYKEVRKSPFNQFLIGLMIPDLVFSFPCVFVCYMSAAVEHFYSSGMCNFQSFFLTWGITGNAWMNLIISLEVYKILKCSRNGIRYIPPKNSNIWKRIVAVYVYASILASLVFIPREDSNFPFKVGVYAGAYCMPVEYSVPSALLLFLVFLPLIAGIPMLVAGYVFYDVYFRSNLMPKNGKGKLLSIYFMRIIIVFFVWWMPGLCVALVFTGFDPWFLWAFGLVWNHLQGSVSALLMLFKPDIKEAVFSFICGCLPLHQESLMSRLLRQSSSGPQARIRIFGQNSQESPQFEEPEVWPQDNSQATSRESQWYAISEIEIKEGIDLNEDSTASAVSQVDPTPQVDIPCVYDDESSEGEIVEC